MIRLEELKEIFKKQNKELLASDLTKLEYPQVARQREIIIENFMLDEYGENWKSCMLASDFFELAIDLGGSFDDEIVDAIVKAKGIVVKPYNPRDWD